jgi:hypothetical protein
MEASQKERAVKTWTEMVKSGEGPYDSTGEYPVGYSRVGGFTLDRPDLFVIVRKKDLEDLEKKAAGRENKL